MPSDPGATPPLVTVGVPVFNEQASLPAVLDSLLAQDYKALQIVVCDNASTDATVAVAQEYAASDPRVEVHTSDVNRGASFNFNRCFHLARGAYFTWASGHDTRRPQAIGKCVAALEDDPALVLCYPRAVLRRFDGSTEPLLQGTVETRGLPPELRLQATVLQLMTCEIVHGVIRSSALARTRLFRRCHGSDHVLLAELSLLGSFHQDDDVLFVRVQNRSEQEQGQLARKLDLVGVTGVARSRPFSVMLVEHAMGAWHVSSGIRKVSAARCATRLCWERWNVQIKAEWPGLRRVYALTVSRLRRIANRRARAT